MRLKAALFLGCGDFFSRHPVKESPLGSMTLPLNLGLSYFQLIVLHLFPQDRSPAGVKPFMTRWNMN